MNSFIDDIEAAVNSQFTIKHSKKTKRQAFITEDYPAICYDPQGFTISLEGMTNVFNLDKPDCTLYYFEPAPEDRDMELFVETVKDLAKTIASDDNINMNYNIDKIQVSFPKRRKIDNVEFVGKIQIQGEVI